MCFISMKVSKNQKERMLTALAREFSFVLFHTFHWHARKNINAGETRHTVLIKLNIHRLHTYLFMFGYSLHYSRVKLKIVNIFLRF